MRHAVAFFHSNRFLSKEMGKMNVTNNIGLSKEKKLFKIY